MIITFQFLLLFIILVTFIGAVGEEKNQMLRTNVTALCITAIIAFLVSVMYL